MTKTTKKTSKKTLSTSVAMQSNNIVAADQQTKRDLFVAAFIVSVTLNFFVIALWVALNVVGNEATTLSVVLGQ